MLLSPVLLSLALLLLIGRGHGAHAGGFKTPGRRPPAGSHAAWSGPSERPWNEGAARALADAEGRVWWAVADRRQAECVFATVVALRRARPGAHVFVWCLDDESLEALQALGHAHCARLKSHALDAHAHLASMGLDSVRLGCGAPGALDALLTALAQPGRYRAGAHEAVARGTRLPCQATVLDDARPGEPPALMFDWRVTAQRRGDALKWLGRHAHALARPVSLDDWERAHTQGDPIRLLKAHL